VGIQVSFSRAASEPSWVEIAKLVLEYLKVLAWPALIAWLALRYKTHIERLLTRFTDESEEIEAKFLGLSAKFRKQITDIAESPVDSSQSRIDISRASALARDQIRVLADVFFSKPHKRRVEAATEIQELSRLLTLNDIVELASSPIAGERVAAGIALREHLKHERSAAERIEVHEALARGLSDPQPRVRYRFIRAAGVHPELIQRSRERLANIARADEDEVVRDEAVRVLGAADK
jgi:hypothetical protein